MAVLGPTMSLETKHAEFERGLDLFNRGHFFDAHEVLEDVWRPLARGRGLRRHLQGMIQLAVAFHHASNGNLAGARSVLARATHNLHGAEGSFPELDLERLRAGLEVWRRYLASSADEEHNKRPRRDDAPPFPKIVLRR